MSLTSLSKKTSQTFSTLIIILMLSCQNNQQWGYDDFFNQTFGIIKEKSVLGNQVNWNALERQVRDSISQFENNADVYRAIAYTVQLMDDGHSLFLDGQKQNGLTNDTLPIPEIITDIIRQNIGYIKLTGFVANINRSGIYARKIRNSLYTLDNEHELSGWIIDLRGNRGGLQSMMTLGLAPLFQDSLIGYYMNNKKEYLPIYCSHQYFYAGSTEIDSLMNNSVLKCNDKPIAVLISSNTVSAGEFLASAFSFQPHTRIFGNQTRGKTTNLELITFKSEARLLLATQYLCNQKKEILYEGIMPNVNCDNEEAVKLASQWILNSQGFKQENRN